MDIGHVYRRGDDCIGKKAMMRVACRRKTKRP